MIPDITVRPLEAHEWQTFKALRIAALTESPDAFRPTAAEAASQPDGYWRAAAHGFAGDDLRLYIAVRDGEPIGLGSAVRDDQGVGHIGAMWVAPAARATGLGRRLFDAICDWLASRGCHTLALWVTEGNAPAESLYASRGFARTGTTGPLRDGSPLRIAEMAKRLTD